MAEQRVRITTRKVKATDTTGEAVKATNHATGATFTAAWDYSQDTVGMHRLAAQVVNMGRPVEYSDEYGETGYVFYGKP